MKISVKLTTSFGSVLVTTIAVFGMICYYTFAESTRLNSDRIITLQSSEIIYQTAKIFSNKVRSIEQQFSIFAKTNACSLNADEETNHFLADVASRSPPFQSISLYYSCARVTPPEFQSWLDEIENNFFEPFLNRQGNDLFLLWPTHTPQGRAFYVIKIDQEQLAAELRANLRIDGAAILLTDNVYPLISPVQQDLVHPLNPDLLYRLAISPDQKSDHIEKEKTGQVYTYRPPDKLFGADLTLVVPKNFYQANLIALKNRILAAMLIVGWVSIWIMLIVAYKISSPIRKLSKVTKDISDYNYSTELEIPPSNDEIGELAENFENMRQKIKNLVTKDPLTRVYNRRFMMHIFELAVLKALREESKLCCIMMDLDHFKLINDAYGHQGGDEVLMAVGKTLRDISRDYDTPARYGGEEFIFILPDTALTDAVAIAERISAAVKKMTIAFEDTEIHCTMSLGVAELNPYGADTPDKIIHNADMALYQAKKNGRDQIVVFQGSDGEGPGQMFATDS